MIRTVHIFSVVHTRWYGSSFALFSRCCPRRRSTNNLTITATEQNWARWGGDSEYFCWLGLNVQAMCTVTLLLCTNPHGFQLRLSLTPLGVGGTTAHGCCPIVDAQSFIFLVSRCVGSTLSSKQLKQQYHSADQTRDPQEPPHVERTTDKRRPGTACRYKVQVTGNMPTTATSATFPKRPSARSNANKKGARPETKEDSGTRSTNPNQGSDGTQ